MSNLAYYFSCIKCPFERYSFVDAYTRKFRRNSSVLRITIRQRASLDSTKSALLFIQEGPVCSIILRNHNTL